jgi:CheY-like chemotaxis protein
MRAARRRILCVEDHEDTCLMLTMPFAQQGHEAVSAGTAAEAVGSAGRGRFDLYGLDVSLRDGSGLELCSRLRAVDPEAKIVFYSGAAYERDRVVGLAMGASAYVTKPGGASWPRRWNCSTGRRLHYLENRIAVFGRCGYLPTCSICLYQIGHLPFLCTLLSLSGLSLRRGTTGRPIRPVIVGALQSSGW